MKRLNFLFILLPFIASAQSIHTVDDPEIRFSLEIPDGWRVEDDGYTLAIVPPKGGSEYFDFTYFETEETTVDRTLEFTLNAFNDPDVTEFEVIKQGEEEINGARATKVTASLLLKGKPFKRLVYLLIKDGQMYILRGHSQPENFEYYQPFFEQIATSLKTEKI